MTDPADDRRLRLISLRDLLKRSIDEAEPHHRAALANQYRATMAELDELAPTVEGDALDELAQRRSPAAEVPKRPARPKPRRAAGR